MVNQAYPSLNDVAPSWADIQSTFSVFQGDVIQMGDIAGLKWSRKVEVGEKRGTSGGRVMARTSGQGSQEASATLYRSGLRQLIKSLMAKAPQRGNQRLISQVSFDILIQHSVPGDAEIYVTKIKGCRYLGEDDDMKEGNEADKLEVTLNPIEIVQIINGVEAVLL